MIDIVAKSIASTTFTRALCKRETFLSENKNDEGLERVNFVKNPCAGSAQADAGQRPECKFVQRRNAECTPRSRSGASECSSTAIVVTVRSCLVVR